MFAAACRILARLVLAAALGVWAFVAPAHESGRGVPVAKPNELEQVYSARAGLPLRQFGYELFARTGDRPATLAGTLPVGAIQDTYSLGIGDRLQIALRSGKTHSTTIYAIDREGRLLVDELPPIQAAGRTLGDIRKELTAVVNAGLGETDVTLSLAELRRIEVTVAGEVAQPGRTNLTSLGTVLDALFTAGGVTRTGSLRRIVLVRAGGGEPRTVDLYQLLQAEANGADMRLSDGDRILVPPRSATAAIAGAVNRPAIYELPPDSAGLSVAGLERLAGGPLRPGARRMLRLTVAADGTEQPVDVPDGERDKTLLSDGDVVVVTPLHENRVGEVRLDGHVRRPGVRALAEQPSVGSLLTPEDLLPRPYLPFAAIERTDPDSRARTLSAVDLTAIFALKDDRALAEGDTVIVLGARDVDFLSARPVLDLLRGREPPADFECAGLAVLARALSADPDGPLAAGAPTRAATRLVPAEGTCPPIFERHPDLLLFALEHAALLTSGVARPGFYPRTGRTESAALTRAAGTVPERKAEIPGSRDIQDRAESQIELVGPFRYPGVRTLARTKSLRVAIGKGQDLKTGVYALFGVIDRFEQPGLVRRLLPFSPREVTTGRFDRSLSDRDRVILFSEAEIRRLHERAEAEAGDYARASGVGNGPGPGRGRSEQADAPVAAGSPEPRPAAGTAVTTALSEHDAALLTLLRDHTIAVRGAVNRPGSYPIAGPTPVTEVIEAAGGLSATADPAGVEVTVDTPGGAGRSLVDLGGISGAESQVGPGDAIRVNARFIAVEARGVQIEGEVRRPGSYDILHGETLSSLIARAGGLTAEAYPAGAVFTRESVRRLEAEQFQRQARDIEQSLAVELFRTDAASRADGIALARQLAAELRTVRPVGRITVQADPGILKARPRLDMLLEPGDRLIIPKRSQTIAVSGEVQAPVVLQFDPEKGAEDYLAAAGGIGRNADDDHAFILLPDGSSRPLAVSAWRHGDTTIPPGSTIVVPRDPHPFDFLETARSVGGALGQLALTAASIAVIGRQ
ncbi:MAG: SLBB domain-containing protein [Rhodospirillaceae bacterium]